MEVAEEYPVSVVCSALGLSRSTYYYCSQKQELEGLRSALLQEVELWPVYGYRRITEELRRKGWRVNGKRIRRLMREMGLQIKPKAPKPYTTNSKHGLERYPNLQRTGGHQA